MEVMPSNQYVNIRYINIYFFCFNSVQTGILEITYIDTPQKAESFLFLLLFSIVLSP